MNLTQSQAQAILSTLREGRPSCRHDVAVLGMVEKLKTAGLLRRVGRGWAVTDAGLSALRTWCARHAPEEMI